MIPRYPTRSLEKQPFINVNRITHVQICFFPSSSDNVQLFKCCVEKYLSSRLLCVCSFCISRFMCSSQKYSVKNVNLLPNNHKSGTESDILKTYKIIMILSNSWVLPQNTTMCEHQHNISNTDFFKRILTCTCIVVLSKALYSIGNTSDRISSLGVFSNIICKFSRSVTVACTVFGAENTDLKEKCNDDKNVWKILKK